MSTYQDSEEEAGSGLLSSIPVVLWQRRWLLIVPAVLALIAGIVAAFVIPPMYESSATVLIESQQLPNDFSENSVNDLIDQRIARARERVLSRQDLIRLIRANGLYQAEQRSQPLSKIVDKMRDATTIAGSSGDVRSMMQGKSTIALTIAFSYSDPAKAQVIAQQYVNHFLEVDASAQTDQAVGAATFLTEQANQLQQQIAAIEDQVTGIKAANGPLLALQAQSTGNPIADASRIDADIAGLETDNARLAMSSTGGGGNAALAAAEANLQAAQAKFSDSHPDVIAYKAQVEAARRNSVAPTSGIGDAQIQSNRQQIQALRSARAMLMSESSSSRAAQARGPAIASQIDQLEKRAELLRDQYRQLGARTQNAQVSARMETEQKGERLMLADPPIVPDAPYRPNRPILIVGSLAAGLALGFGLVLLFELLLRPIRGANAVRMATGSAPIAIVPDFERNPHFVIRWLEKRNRRKARA